MSVKIMGKVWDLELPHNKLIVLLAMADHADHEGNNVFPSQGLVAWKTGYSIDQVRRIQRALVKDKLLKIESNDPGKPIKYSIDLTMGKLKPAYTPGIAVQDLAGRKTLHNDAPPDPLQNAAPTPGIAVQDEPSIEPSIETITIGVGEVFRFYEDMVGSMTGYMIDVLKDAIETYSADWLIDAMKIAIEQNKRNWKYTEGILKRWKREGKKSQSDAPKKNDDIPTINGKVVYIPATNQTMIWNDDRNGWDTYDGKLESRPA